MSLGIAVGKAELDARAGQVALNLRQAFYQVGLVKDLLDTLTVGNLETMGYTTYEANAIKSAFSDLATLRDVWQGSAAQTPAHDFRLWAKLLWGFGG